MAPGGATRANQRRALSGGQTPALHFLIPPSTIGLQIGTFRRWRAGIEVDWRAHPGSESGTCFRSNRSCLLSPAHEGMKMGVWLLELFAGHLPPSATPLDSLSSQTKCNTLLRCCHGDSNTNRSPLKNGVKLPDYVPPDPRSGKSLQIWIARHRPLLES